ncbi:MAG: hypothetical protein ABIE84_03225 [bacterium]
MPATIGRSALLREDAGHVEVRPRIRGDQAFSFDLRVDGRDAGIWEMQVVEACPPHWQEVPDLFHIYGGVFGVEEEFRYSSGAISQYATAFRRFVVNNYLAPAYPGWIYRAETTVTAQLRVHRVAHGIERLVEVSAARWQAHFYLETIQESD